jgi:hypothetical protein
MHGLFDWVSGAWDWVKGAVVSFTSWVSKQWDNLKTWVVDRWNDLKKWTKDLWTTLINKVAGAVQKAKDFKDKVVSWVINKALPILSLVFKCARIFLTIASKIMGIIKAIAQVVTGNVLKLVDMAINVICAYQTIIDLWGLMKKVWETPGDRRGYFVGKFVGVLLDFIASVASFKSKEDAVTPEASSKEIAASLKDNKSGGVKDFVTTLGEKMDTVDEWKDKAESAENAVNQAINLASKGLGLTEKENIRQIAAKAGGKCLNFDSEFIGNSDRDVETRTCDNSADNKWSIRPTADSFYVIVNQDIPSQALIDVGDKSVQMRTGWSLTKDQFKWQFITHEFGTRFAQIKSKNGHCLSTKGSTGNVELAYVTCDMNNPSQFFQLMNPKAE